jgi:hypothetical protein
MIALSPILYERGPGSTPSDNLRGRAESWEQTIADRFGYESARTSFQCTLAEARAWARPEQLGRHLEVYTPKGRRCWEGRLIEIEVSIGRAKVVLSLKDMANRFTVRYSTGATGATSETSITYTNDASIALYGVRDRLKNLSNVSATGAANYAQAALKQIAFPRSKQPSEAGSGDRGGDITVSLVFSGYYDTLDDVITSSTSESMTATDEQLLDLLASYNATNNWFSTDRTDIVATGVSDTEWIDPDTTYREKIETLLVQGDSAHERLHWGCFDDRRFVVRRWAGSTPDVITYYESARTGAIYDAYGNVVDPWDVRPDAMACIIDLPDTAAATPAGAIDGATRKYVARVSLSISASGVRVRLEPDNVDSLETLLSNPTGAGPAATSARQAAIERATQATARPLFPAADNPERYNDGVWQPQSGGTGVANTGTLTVPSDGTIDLSGGTVTNSGGGNVDLSTGEGIGGAGQVGVTTEGGTGGGIPIWLDEDTLGTATAGVDFAAASHTHTATAVTDFSEAVDDRVASLLQAGTGISLSYNDSGGTLTISTSGLVSGSGAGGRITQWNGTGSVEASTLVKSGSGVLTLSASSNVTLTVSGSINISGASASSGQVLAYNGTAFVPTTLSSVSGSGTSGRVAYWSGMNTLTSDSGMTWDATNNRLTVGEIITNEGNRWDLGDKVGGTPSTTHVVKVTINGTAHYLLASTTAGPG